MGSMLKLSNSRTYYFIKLKAYITIPGSNITFRFHNQGGMDRPIAPDDEQPLRLQQPLDRSMHCLQK